MEKKTEYVWGIGSVILSSISIIFLFLGEIVNSRVGVPVFLEIILQFFYLFLPITGFVFAFIGKVRCEYGTVARKLCNIGAGICIIMSAIFIWICFLLVWQNLFSLSEQVASITGLVDMGLIVGYFLIAYIRGKILWFI